MLFLLSCVWIAVSLAAGRLAGTLAPPAAADLVAEAIAALSLFGGFLLLARTGIADLRPLSSIGFVKRPTSKDEFGRGLALGWGIALALVLLAWVTGHLHPEVILTAASLLATATGLLRCVLFAVTVQLVAAGLPVRLLTRIASAPVTLLAAMALAWLLALRSGPVPLTAVLTLVLTVGMLVTGFLRTRALWFSLGLQIGWMLVQQALFGTGSPYTPATSGVVQNTSAWLNGAAFSPELSVMTLLIVAAAWIILLPLTRTYAWHYTYQPPAAGGVAMEVAPPPQHAAEAALQPKAPLVQISGAAVPPPPTPHP